MSRKTMFPGKRIALEQSLASDFQTSALEIEMVDNVALIIDCNNVTENDGTFAVQLRIRQDANNVSEWTSLTLSSVPTLSDADDQFFINLNQLPPCELRVTFTAPGSGSPDGDCNIWFSATQI